MYSCPRCGTVLVGNPRRHDIKDLTSTNPCQFVPQGLQRNTGVFFEPKTAEKVLSDNQHEADKHGICGAKDAITGETVTIEYETTYSKNVPCSCMVRVFPYISKSLEWSIVMFESRQKSSTGCMASNPIKHHTAFDGR